MKTRPSGEEPGEDFDVRKIHGQIWREHEEPFERYNAIPWWLKHLVFVPLCISAIWYLMVYNGGFDSQEYYEGTSELDYSMGSAQLADSGADTAKTPETASTGAAAAGPDGKSVYASYCVACHQANGAGVPGAFPPIVDSEWVAGSEKILASVVLDGLSGPISVNGVDYNGAMPGWGATLSDEEVAAVLTYVRAEWGDGAAAVDSELVKTLRAEHGTRAPWTVEELKTAYPE